MNSDSNQYVGAAVNNHSGAMAETMRIVLLILSPGWSERVLKNTPFVARVCVRVVGIESERDLLTKRDCRVLFVAFGDAQEVPSS